MTLIAIQNPTRQFDRSRVAPSIASRRVASPTYVGSSVIGAWRMVGKKTNVNNCGALSDGPTNRSKVSPSLRTT